MNEFDREKVQANVKEAETDDLLDRVTVYRSGMEAEALEMIEAELTRREITPEAIEEHRQKQSEVLVDENGIAVRCRHCRRPATVQIWRWHRLGGLIPIFPRRTAYCPKHIPEPE